MTVICTFLYPIKKIRDFSYSYPNSINTEIFVKTKMDSSVLNCSDTPTTKIKYYLRDQTNQKRTKQHFMHLKKNKKRIEG